MQFLCDLYETAQEANKNKIKNKIDDVINDRMDLGHYGELVQSKKVLQFFIDHGNFSDKRSVIKYLFFLQEIWKESKDEEIKALMQQFYQDKAVNITNIPSFEQWVDLKPEDLPQIYINDRRSFGLFVGLILERGGKFDEANKIYHYTYTKTWASPWGYFRSACLEFTNKVGDEFREMTDYKRSLNGCITDFSGSDLETLVEYYQLDPSNPKDKTVTQYAAMEGSSKAMDVAEKFAENSQEEKAFLEQVKVLLKT